MLKFFLFVFARSHASRRYASPEDALLWVRDPLSHPAIEIMSERELGDLPFRR